MNKYYIKRERGTGNSGQTPRRRQAQGNADQDREKGELHENLNPKQLWTLSRRTGIGNLKLQNLKKKKMGGLKIPFAFPLPSFLHPKADKNIQLSIKIFFKYLIKYLSKYLIKYLTISSIVTCIGLFFGGEILPVSSANIPAQLLPSLRGFFGKPKLIYTFKGHSGTIKSLAFGPKGKMLVSGGAGNDGVIRIWNLKKGKRMGIIRKAHQTAVLSLLISPDGNTLVSCSSDNTINLWNLNNLKFTRAFVEHTSNILSLAVSPNSKTLVSGALDGIRVWDLPQQRPLGSLTNFGNSIYTVAISPNGQTLASGDSKGAIELWDLKSGKLIRTFVAHARSVNSVAFTPKGNTLVSASGDERTIKLWNLKSGELTRTFQAHTGGIKTVAINPQGKIIASSGTDGIMLWDLTTGKLLSKLHGHSDWVSALAWSPDGKMLASGSFDKQVKIWQFQ